MVACELSTSMLWARVIRGTSSSEKSVTPRSAAARASPGIPSGSHKPITTCPACIWPSSPAHCSAFAPAARITSRQSASRASARETTFAPFSAYRSSGKPALAPAPALDPHFKARFDQRADRRRDQRHAPLARTCFFQCGDNHRCVLVSRSSECGRSCDGGSRCACHQPTPSAHEIVAGSTTSSIQSGPMAVVVHSVAASTAELHRSRRVGTGQT